MNGSSPKMAGERGAISRKLENRANGYTFAFGKPIRICVTLTRLNEVQIFFAFLARQTSRHADYGTDSLTCSTEKFCRRKKTS
jgi:hypothetical protein